MRGETKQGKRVPIKSIISLFLPMANSKYFKKQSDSCHLELQTLRIPAGRFIKPLDIGWNCCPERSSHQFLLLFDLFNLFPHWIFPSFFHSMSAASPPCETRPTGVAADVWYRNKRQVAAAWRLVWSLKLTSEGRLHGGLHHPDQQLETLGVLGEAGGERRQGVGMTTQVLQGNPLTEVGLD